MKKITGLVIILVVLVLGSYYGMGYLTEKKVKEDLKTVNQSNGLTANIESYQRGWFTSKAVLDWGLHVPEHVITTADGQSENVPAQDFQMKMPLTIYHGPVIFADKSVKFGLGFAHTQLGLPQQFAEQLNNAFSSESTQPKLDLSLFVSYLANSSIDASVPAFKLVSKQGNGQLDWLGMTSSTSLSSDMKKVNGNITVDGLRIAKDQIKTNMSSVTSEYNVHKTDIGLFVGDASLSFPSLVVTNGDKKIFELAQFDVHSDTNIEEGLFSSHFKSSIEKIAANDKIYGPGHVDLAIRNLDADTLAKINQQANQLQQGGSDAQRQQALLAILPELPQLLSKGAEFEVTELNFVMPQGTIEGNLLVSLPKSEITNPFELIQKVQGSGKLKVPAVVVKDFIAESIRQKMLLPPQPQTIQQGLVQQMQQQANPSATAGGSNSATPLTTTDLNAVAQQAAATADKQIATMVQSGVLAAQGNDYVIEINLNQGQLMVNGKPFSPAMLKFQ